MTGTLKSNLRFEARHLGFGTSGRRGEVVHLTQLEIYINALAELRYLQSLPVSEGGIVPGDPFFFAYDLRPSSTGFVPEQQRRGEIAQAIERAIRDAGMQPVNLGILPTPALTHYALSQGQGSIMITGSHIPFDRNGYKLNTSKGELLKEHEAPITEAVQGVRQEVYAAPYDESLFDADGLFKRGHTDLSSESHAARAVYIDRYLSFFQPSSLKGMRLLVYQHSAVGRDLLVELLQKLGAETIPVGRSDRFVPIDTENIDPEQLRSIQELATAAIAEHGHVDAVVSTDGDSDRPLILGVNRETGAVRFFGGDLVGMITAEFLRADAVVVPISCNDGIDRGSLAGILQPKTKIGSPHVIAGMQKATALGKRTVCGWEANGGFLLGSDVTRGTKLLKALPTRDAFLPILCTLFSAQEAGVSLEELFSGLPKRYSRAALLRDFPRQVALRMIERLSPKDPSVQDVRFEGNGAVFLNASGGEVPGSTGILENVKRVREILGEIFRSDLGFTSIGKLNVLDGVRVTFSNGEVAHIRPSGNADELRIYAVADSPQRADAIAAMAVKRPDGLLLRLEETLR
jgi:phosphomannomutase